MLSIGVLWNTPPQHLLHEEIFKSLLQTKCSSDWQETIQQAEISVHEAVSDSQILEVIKLIEVGNHIDLACWKAGVSGLALSSSTVYKTWLELKEKQVDDENKGSCAAYKSGYDSGTKNSDNSICP